MPGDAIGVLLVEDCAADAQATSDMLAFARAPRCTLTRAALLSEAAQALGRERFEVVLLDLGLPDAVGIEGVSALRAAAPETAIIVLSGIGSEAIALQALEAGAQDYLVKGRADEDALQRSIRFALARRDADVAQRRVAAIVESSEDAILTNDLATTITSWNRGAERLWGYTAQEAVGRPLAMLMPPERGDAARTIIARLLAGEHVGQYEARCVCKDGSVKIAAVTVAAIRDAVGGVLAISSIARDITDSTRAAEALRAAEERFRVAFEEAPIGMAIVSLDRRYIRVNGALCRMTGYRSAELEGRPTRSINHRDDPGLGEAELQRLIDGETTHLTADRHWVHADGHSLWIDLNITCVRDGDGAPQHFLAQMQEITERRRHEAQLLYMADHDPLTGLLNRRAFERELRSHVARAGRYGCGGAALMIDLDHFKHFNDTLGHQAGDELIMRVADALARRLRASDVLARLGGDEFAVILPSADAAGTLEVVAELLDCVRSAGVPEAAGAGALTASIGVAHFADGAEPDPGDVMVNADRAMYEAKQNGRDRACVHQASMPTMRCGAPRDA